MKPAILDLASTAHIFPLTTCLGMGMEDRYLPRYPTPSHEERKRLDLRKSHQHAEPNATFQDILMDGIQLWY